MRTALKGVRDRMEARKADKALDTEKNEAGVSGIIELVIVLVILGILTAILLPNFLGTTQTAKNKSAESNLSTAVTDAQTYYANNASSFGTSAANVQSAIQSAEPGLSSLIVTSGATTTAGQILVAAANGNQVVLGVYSPGAQNGAGGCIYASLNNSTTTGSGVYNASAGTSYASASGACSSTGLSALTWQSTMP